MAMAAVPLVGQIGVFLARDILKEAGYWGVFLHVAATLRFCPPKNLACRFVLLGGNCI